jgi:hypothetical protein
MPRVDVSAYAIDFDALHLGRRIGEGSFGKVYVATYHETQVAVKVLVDETTALDRGADAAALRNLSSPVMAALAQEAGLMASLRHPNIVQFMGMCTLPPCVVTEYCARGSLTDVLKAGRTGKPAAAADLSWRRRLGMALDAATGMLHLHARSPPIIHRDLKSPNLLVDVHWRVKVRPRPRRRAAAASWHAPCRPPPSCPPLGNTRDPSSSGTMHRQPRSPRLSTAGVRFQPVQAGGGVDPEQQPGRHGERTDRRPPQDREGERGQGLILAQRARPHVAATRVSCSPAPLPAAPCRTRGGWRPS